MCVCVCVCVCLFQICAHVRFFFLNFICVCRFQRRKAQKGKSKRSSEEAQARWQRKVCFETKERHFPPPLCIINPIIIIIILLFGSQPVKSECEKGERKCQCAATGGSRSLRPDDHGLTQQQQPPHTLSERVCQCGPPI